MRSPGKIIPFWKLRIFFFLTKSLKNDIDHLTTHCCPQYCHHHRYDKISHHQVFHNFSCSFFSKLYTFKNEFFPKNRTNNRTSQKKVLTNSNSSRGRDNLKQLCPLQRYSYKFLSIEGSCFKSCTSQYSALQ